MCMCVCMHGCMYARVVLPMRTYALTYLHTQVHKHMHTSSQAYRQKCAARFRGGNLSSVQALRYKCHRMNMRTVRPCSLVLSFASSLSQKGHSLLRTALPLVVPHIMWSHCDAQRARRVLGTVFTSSKLYIKKYRETSQHARPSPMSQSEAAVRGTV